MTPEERQMLVDLFERIRSTNAGPRDPQAEAFINDAVRAVPQSPYVLAQTVLVQQHAVENLQQRIDELEAQAQAAAAPPPTSFLGSLFGGSSAPPRPASGYDASAYQRGANAPPPPPPQPSYAPPPPPYAPQQPYAPPQAGPWGAPPAPASGGFLSNALHTAAGVAGGMVLANAVGSLFGGHGGGAFGGRGFGDTGLGAPHETINNYYSETPDSAGGHAQDVLQDMDQDDSQDVADSGFDGGSDNGFDS